MANCLELRSLAHGGGQYGHARIGLHLLENGLAHHVSVCPRGGLLEGPHTSVALLKRRGGMKVHRIFRRWLEPVALLGNHVQQDRVWDVLYHRQVLAKLRNAMAGNRSDIPEVKL